MSVASYCCQRHGSKVRHKVCCLENMDDGTYGYLRDFDWSMRMILSSDKLSGLGKPVVQLKLDTSAGDSSVVQEHLMELDLKEITALLKVLKNAQTAAQVK